MEEAMHGALSPQLRVRLYELFHQLRDLLPDEREDRIVDACAGEPALEAELRALLAVDETLPPNFLELALREV